MKQNSMYLNILGALMLATPLGNLMYAQSPEEKPKVEVRNVHHGLAVAADDDLKAEAGKSQYASEKDLSKTEVKQAIKKQRQDRRQERRERRWQESNHYYDSGNYRGYSPGHYHGSYRYGRHHYRGYRHRYSYRYCY